MTSRYSSYARRPVEVAVVAVLAWVVGALQVVLGVLLLVGVLRSTVSVVDALFSVLLGVVTVMITIGLFKGTAFARNFAAVALVCSVISNVLRATVAGAPSPIASVVVILLALAALGVLYSSRANRFFVR